MSFRKKKPSPPSSIPTSPLAGDFKDDVNTTAQEIFAELSLEESSNLQTPPLPSPPLSTTFLMPNQISPAAPLERILSSPAEPSPAKTTPYLEPMYRSRPIGKLTAADLSPLSSSPLAPTPTFPSPTITTPFYKAKEVSGSPLLTPPMKKAAARKRPVAPRQKPILPQVTPPSVPSSAVKKIDEKMTALTNISPTLLSPEFPSPPISTPFLQSGAAESRVPKSVLNQTQLVAASPTIAPPAMARKQQPPRHYQQPPTASLALVPQPGGATLVTPVQRRVTASELPRLKSPPKSTPLDPNANVIKYERHAAHRNPASPMLAVIKKDTNVSATTSGQAGKPSSAASGSLYSVFFEKENAATTASAVPIAPVAPGTTQPVQQLILIHTLP